MIPSHLGHLMQAYPVKSIKYCIAICLRRLKCFLITSGASGSIACRMDLPISFPFISIPTITPRMNESNRLKMLFKFSPMIFCSLKKYLFKEAWIGFRKLHDCLDSCNLLFLGRLYFKFINGSFNSMASYFKD